MMQPTAELIQFIQEPQFSSFLATLGFRRLCRIPRLPAHQKVDELIGHLHGSGIIPANAAPDAAHIAFPTVHAMDFLLT